MSKSRLSLDGHRLYCKPLNHSFYQLSDTSSLSLPLFSFPSPAPPSLPPLLLSEPGVVSSSTDEGDAGGDALHARQLETKTTNSGGVPRSDTCLPVHHGKGVERRGEGRGGEEL